MPKILGFPEKPLYNSVKAYLSELAKDIAEMVVDPVKMERFREQLKKYADFWNQWSTFDESQPRSRKIDQMRKYWKVKIGILAGLLFVLMGL